jgi:hypothetical protein
MERLLFRAAESRPTFSTDGLIEGTTPLLVDDHDPAALVRETLLDERASVVKAAEAPFLVDPGNPTGIKDLDLIVGVIFSPPFALVHGAYPWAGCT